MKTLRTPRALVASFLLLASLAIPLRAQLTWVGDGITNDVTDPLNWSGGTYTGSGVENVTFNVVGPTYSSVYIPYTGAPLQHITFANGAIYDFNGDGESSYLLLNGNLSTGTSGDIIFNSDLQIELSATNHTAFVDGTSTVTVESLVSDYDNSSSVTKTGTGTLILSGSNDFSGGVNVQTGTLLLGSSSDIYSGPVGTGTLTLNAGTTLGLDATESSFTLDNIITLANTGSPVTIDTGSYNSLSLNGTISGSAALSVSGTGSLSVNGSNDFTGGLTVNSGAIVNLYNDTSAGTGTLTLQGGSELNTFNDGDITLANAVVLTGGGDPYAHIEDNSYGMKFTGLITGAGGLDWCTDYNLTLTGANTFAGGVYMREGTLLLGASSTGPAGSPTSGPAGTGGIILMYDTSIGAMFGAGPITLGNNISVTSDDEFPAYLDASNENLTFTGTISGTGVIQTIGSNTVTLTGNNTFSGELYAGVPQLNLSNNAASQAVLALGFSSGVNFTGTSPTIGGLEADASSDTVNLLAGSTLTINQTEDTDFAGQIVAGGAGVNVTKQGSGSLTFSHANTYDGTTTITGGTLVYGADNAFGTSAVVVNGGTLKIANGATFTSPLTLTAGTLAGNYTFSTPQSFGAGVTLSPGNSPGTMTFAAGYAPTNGVTTNFEFNSAVNNPGITSDLIAVTGGTLNLSGLTAGGYTLMLISLVDVGNNPGAIADLSGSAAWTIFTSTNALTTFNASLFTIDQSQFVNPGIFSLTQSGNDIVLNFTPVPEPSTYALLALGLMGTGLAAWRKRRRA